MYCNTVLRAEFPGKCSEAGIPCPETMTNLIPYEVISDNGKLMALFCVYTSDLPEVFKHSARRNNVMLMWLNRISLADIFDDMLQRLEMDRILDMDLACFADDDEGIELLLQSGYIQGGTVDSHIYFSKNAVCAAKSLDNRKSVSVNVSDIRAAAGVLSDATVDLFLTTLSAFGKQVTAEEARAFIEQHSASAKDIPAIVEEFISKE